MNRVVTSRVAALMAMAMAIAIAACSDANGSRPNLTGPDASTSSGGSSDTAGGTPPPTNPGGGHSDTSVTPKPNPKPVASFTLGVHVGSLRHGTTDTLTTDPIAGATVSVFEQTLTSAPHGGADTVNISETLVASGTSDANGNFTAPNLKGVSVYAIKVTPPAGSDFQPVTQFVNQAFADLVNVSVTLFKR